MFRSAQFPTAARSILMNATHSSRPFPKTTASRIFGKNFSLFSTYFGANSDPSAILPTSLARSMIRRCPVSGSMNPASPVATQPSASLVPAVLSGFL